MTLFIPHLVWLRDVIIWRYHVISRNLSKTLGIWWSVICGQKIHIRLGTSWSVICGQKIHIYYLVIISRIFRKNLIWGRHGASFVDKKSTVIFTRIICTVFCFSLWFIEQRLLPIGNEKEVLKHKQSDKISENCNSVFLNGKYQSVSSITADLGQTQRICDYTVRGHSQFDR